MGLAIAATERPKKLAAQKTGKSSDGRAGGRGKEKPSEKFSEGLADAKRTLAIAAKAVGMSRPRCEKRTPRRIRRNE